MCAFLTVCECVAMVVGVSARGGGGDKFLLAQSKI